jgi:hypothetical protein
VGSGLLASGYDLLIPGLWPGHGALNDFDPCVLVPVLTYLTDGTTLPPAGTTCTQHFDPFGG